MSLFLPIPLAAEILVTPNYKVEITSNCAEGNVTCDRVVGATTNLRDGTKVRLTGETQHSLCKDRVTQCKFSGYRFESGDVSYYISSHGEFLILKNDSEILVQEEGDWKY